MIHIGLEGHSADFNKLQELFKLGQLNEILGIPVEDISLVFKKNTDKDKEIENEEKFRLDWASRISKQALDYSLEKRYAEAEPLYLQALKLFQQLSGKQHPHVATILNDLAILMGITILLKKENC